MRNQLLVAAGLASVMVTAQAATQIEISDWDSNADGHISHSEWNQHCPASNIYSNWDTDNDGLIDDDEYSTGLFRHWDENDNGVLEENEWSRANDNWFNDYSVEYSAWDSDGDGFLEYREFDAGLGKTSYYADWDVNNTLFIEKSDFCQSLFNQADADDDDRINVGEFDTDVVTWYIY